MDFLTCQFNPIFEFVFLYLSPIYEMHNFPSEQCKCNMRIEVELSADLMIVEWWRKSGTNMK
jgi:hypothetical protein